MFGFAAMATLVLLALPALASDPLDGIRIEPEFTGKPCERAKNSEAGSMQTATAKTPGKKS